MVASTRLIAGLTFLSRVLGLARECAFGVFFGTGPLLSAFRIAFMVPNLARRLFGEGALSAAFIPIFTRALTDPDEHHARRSMVFTAPETSRQIAHAQFSSFVPATATPTSRSSILVHVTLRIERGK